MTSDVFQERPLNEASTFKRCHFADPSSGSTTAKDTSRADSGRVRSGCKALDSPEVAPENLDVPRAVFVVSMQEWYKTTLAEEEVEVGH